MNVVVFASGRGSNFAAIADAVRSGALPDVKILALFCNNPRANALKLAKAREVPAETIDWKEFGTGTAFDRTAYERVLVERARRYAPDLICLAGYSLLLGPTMVREWAKRMINIHPSLLPAFKGLHAQRQALEYGVRWTGCTVHFVTEELDAGPIILQSVIEVRDEDTEESLVARLLPIEHETYVEAIRRLSTREFHLQNRRICWDD